MPTPPWIDSYTGVYATPQLVGRERERARVREIMARSSPGPQIIFIVGDGGIGKTRFLDDALQTARDAASACVANTKLDLYHSPFHSAAGFVAALYRTIVPPLNRFSDYDREARILERMALSGSIAGRADQHRKVLDTFAANLKDSCEKSRMVLALDTVEYLLYGSSAGAVPTFYTAEAWTWFCSVLPGLKNAVVLAAGRPEADPLLQQLRSLLRGRVSVIELRPFSAKESDQYFVAVAKVAEQSSREIADRVRALPGAVRHRAHRLVGGRPIRLALLVDYLSIAGQDKLSRLLKQGGAAARGAGQAAQDTMEEQLVGRIMENREYADTISALGRVPKGADDRLLARLLHVTPAEAQALLSDIQRLSFVKTRPADNRVFLHDEMYALLRRRIYDRADDAELADRAGEAIRRYYDDEIERCRQELNDIYAPVEARQAFSADLGALTTQRTRLANLLVEEVYYRLRQDASKGVRRYYRFLHEALLCGDADLCQQLDAELRRFLAESKGGLPDIERVVIADLLALYPVEKAWAEQKYADVVKEAERLRLEQAAIGSDHKLLMQSAVNVWDATARIYLGGPDNIAQARQQLDHVIKDLQRVVDSAEIEGGLPNLWTWCCQVFLALALRVSGYCYRVSGLMQPARDHYPRALHLWQEVNLRAEVAGTLNDRGFVLAEMGEFNDARSLVERALALRRRLGPRSPVGLSLNTLGLIALREGNYQTAMAYCEQALALFRLLEDERGTGLALVGLAEAQRRHAGTAAVPDAGDKVRLLREARDFAQDALALFDKSHEVSRQVEALIEIGCACRDVVQVRHSEPSARDDVNRMKTESEYALRRAADLAGDEILYRKVDALVNLAWLAYYSDNVELYREASTKAESSISDDYRIRRETGKPAVEADKAYVLVWPQLGKLYSLYGHFAFDKYTHPKSAVRPEHRQPNEDLHEVALNYTWSLQYARLYSPQEYRDLRRAKDEIDSRIAALDVVELRYLAQVVTVVEDEFHLGESEIERFLKNRAHWYGKP